MFLSWTWFRTVPNFLLPSQRTLDKGYKDSPFKTDGISPEAVGSFLQKLKDAQHIFDSELPSLQTLVHLYVSGDGLGCEYLLGAFFVTN